jgi:hypothetical protein
MCSRFIQELYYVDATKLLKSVQISLMRISTTMLRIRRISDRIEFACHVPAARREQLAEYYAGATSSAGLS